ncbi:unnamed protein product [Arctia plantaginis]|uniref:Chitin-binding type-2 domain-containing protein n=1 Tax=Arctia plantaginis TaxID=874455 RepID=A0A8S1AFH3_ARCPL|nr:unnamed protein product [Arctia plantaginis]
MVGCGSYSNRQRAGGKLSDLPSLGAGRAARAHPTASQSIRDAHRDNMSPVWILLTLLPVLGGSVRFNCKGRILGAYYADAKSGCKAFHVCVRVAGGGIRDFRFFCPPGTLFHQEAQTCTDWGDDDPLACPANIYDGFDTKKLTGNRDEEAEFGLQRAETGDRRLSQNNVASSRPDSDLRAAHSSDFFSGQRDRGRDESSPTSPPVSPSPSSQIYSRQPSRRPTSARAFPTTQYTTPAPSPSPQPSNRPQYEGGSKRKLVRKRPIYVPTKAAITTVPPVSVPQQNYAEPLQQSQQNYNQQQNYNSKQNANPQQNFNLQNNYNAQPNFNRRVPPQNKQFYTTTPDVPPQYQEYKDEYVEVSRVTPKQNRFYPKSVSSTSLPQTTNSQRYNKNDGLIEIYNYDSQSTPGINVQKENRPLKVKNNFNENVPRDPEFQRTKNFNFNNARDSPATTDYSVSTRAFPTTTVAYKNYNSVPYEPEKANYVPYSKQNNFNSNYPTTTSASITTIYTTSRPEPPPNLNTIAYNTNIGFNAQTNNYASGEDDGQYHPPEGEDDGLYKPEVYDRELLSGAHSLNIAASGNRLQEDRKTYSKTKSPHKLVAQTAAPRPFKPAPTPTIPPTTRAQETIYTTTQQPQTVNTQRTFDYFQTYTTTSRPSDYLAIGQTLAPANELPARQTTTAVPPVKETRPPRPATRAPAPATQPTVPPTAAPRSPHFAQPANKKEDNSYDYAYYDSDPGFSEYDQIEEFGKTNKKKRS